MLHEQKILTGFVDPGITIQAETVETLLGFQGGEIHICQGPDKTVRVTRDALRSLISVLTEIADSLGV